jgi:hypothetical protein
MLFCQANRARTDTNLEDFPLRQGDHPRTHFLVWIT